MITNNTNIDLTLAVWLASDDYDYINEDNYISVTKLMSPIRQIVLSSRLTKGKDVDVADLIASRMGTAIHDSIERSWEKVTPRLLEQLTGSKALSKQLVVNPTELQEDQIPIYMEQRHFKEIDGWTVGGKFDMVFDGILYDHKSTSAFTWLYGTKDEDHIMQGSLYKWISPQIITEDIMKINFIFTDWNQQSAKTNISYPDCRVKTKTHAIKPVAETEAWVKAKLNQINKYMDSPQKDLPECTREELWMSDPVYKYYSDPRKTDGRATKNFDNLLDADLHKQKMGKGVVIAVDPAPKRCAYCPVFEICEQRKRMIPDV